MTYLTLDIIKAHLNINSGYTADDNYLTMLGGAVEGVVEHAIDDKLEDLEDSNGQIPLPLIQAALLLLGTYYSNRENISYTTAIEVPMTYSYLIDLYRNYGNTTTSPEAMLTELAAKVNELETYMAYDKNRTITGVGVDVATSGQSTTITLDVVDEGEY